jgi:hypothetical protein
MLNASQLGFRASHNTTLQYMRLTDHLALNFNNNISKAAVFLDIEKAFETIWHSGLLYKLSKSELSTSLIKLSSSFLSQRKFMFRQKAKCLRQGKCEQECFKFMFCSLLCTICIYVNDATKIPSVYLALFADDTCLYGTDREESFGVRKHQRGLNSMETWCKR